MDLCGDGAVRIGVHESRRLFSELKLVKEKLC